MDALPDGKPLFSSFRMITAKFSSVPKFRNFTVVTVALQAAKCLNFTDSLKKGSQHKALSKTRKEITH